MEGGRKRRRNQSIAMQKRKRSKESPTPTAPLLLKAIWQLTDISEGSGAHN
jgi:hypothetical protein